ncbi:MAG: class I SAM-dependent methyltransferase [Caldilineaceae bacterium]|nr:class I SAM-dependent methyltransferase [Caldilineaceae bacterium]
MADDRVNYDEISRVYDEVRGVDRAVIQSLLNGVDLDASCAVLDIGCGTGNYTDVMQRLMQARITGLDQSEGMLAKARAKNGQIDFRQGDAQQMLFAGASFDFVYMTDVIHHVTEIGRLLGEIARVLRPGGKVCIVTQSHAQIGRRPIAAFFPATVAVDTARYPDIPQIVAAAAAHSLAFVREERLGEGEPTLYGQPFLAAVRARGYSMLRLISDEEYRRGLAQVEAQLAQGDLAVPKAGKTLIWLQK